MEWVIRFDDNGEGLSMADIAALEGLATSLGFSATISSAVLDAPQEPSDAEMALAIQKTLREFPPPVIEKWLGHHTVNSDELAEELDFWANWATHERRGAAPEPSPTNSTDKFQHADQVMTPTGRIGAVIGTWCGRVFIAHSEESHTVWGEESLTLISRAAPQVEPPVFNPKFKPGDHVLWYGNEVIVEVVEWHADGYFYEFIEPDDENQRHYEIAESDLSGASLGDANG